MENNEQVCSDTDTRHPSLAAKLRARDTYLAVNEVAALLSINKFTLYDWVKADRIPAQRIGSLIKFDPWKLAVWLDKQSIAA